MLEQDMAFINSKLQWMSSEIPAGRLGDLTGLWADEIGLRIENLFRQDQ